MKNIFSAVLILSILSSNSSAKFARVPLGLRTSTLVTAPSVIVTGLSHSVTLAPSLPMLEATFTLPMSAPIAVPTTVKQAFPPVQKVTLRSSLKKAGAPPVQKRAPIAASRHWTGVFDGIQGHQTSIPVPVGVVLNAADNSDNLPALSAWDGEGGFVPQAVPPVSKIPGDTALQKHVAFFDRDGDGIITVSDTRFRLRQLGFSWPKAAFLALAIHAGLASSTGGSWGNKLRLRLRVDKMHLGKHAADTGIYDDQGNFVQEAFDNVFKDFAKTNKDFLTESEFQTMILANSKRRPGFIGKLGAKAEFGLLLDIAADGESNGERTISRTHMEQFYDGTLLYRLVGEL